MPLVPSASTKATSKPSTVAPTIALEHDAVAARILDAAFEQFCLVGIRRSSMEDIARRAQVGRVTIYRKFASNDKLVSALFRRETRAAIATVQAAIDGIDDVETRFVEGFVAGIRAVRSHRLIQAMLATEPETALPLLTTRAAGGLALARAFMAHEIASARQQLGLPATDAEQVAEIFARLIHSLVLTPETCLPLDDDAGIRELARRCIVPLVTSDTSATSDKQRQRTRSAQITKSSKKTTPRPRKRA